MGEKKSNYLKSTSFPHSEIDPFILTSPEDANYNCVAWALGDTENWWEPDEDYFWLEGLDFDDTLQTVQRLFEHFGFEAITHPNWENQLEKIALYSNDGIFCSHIAKQTIDGNWTSKLGVSFDVNHSLTTLKEGIYGYPAVILQKQKR
jgi:hypothetical protein